MPISSLPADVTVDGYTVTISGEGSVENKVPLPTIVAGQRATEKSEYTDGTDTAIIPKGFTVSNAEGEKTIANGLVIYDIPESEVASVNWTAKTGDVYTVQTLYNQFVWVPVPTASEFIRHDGYCDGSLQTYVSGGKATEPFASGYEDESSEYTAMYNSVTTNKGFYVARYEASNNSGTVESKQGKSVWNKIPWGTSMSDIGTSGAVYKSQQMYKNKTGYEVTSTLIYGVEWDAIMAWIDPAYKTGDCDKTNSFVANSTGNGNYYDVSSTYGKPGNTGLFAVKNIYDLAGNVWEWTMEAFGTSFRVHRGGVYGRNGSNAPASYRFDHNPGNSNDGGLGFRLALYL